jgi:hypothetical protein
VALTPCGRDYEHPPHGGPTATRDASCDGRFVKDNVVPFPSKEEESLDPGAAAHLAATRHIALCWDLLEQENEGVEIDWSQYDVMAPFDGCTDCIVREILYAGIRSLQESGVLPSP